MKKKESRRFERYEANRHVFYRKPPATDYRLARTINISKNGLLLESVESISKNDNLDITLRIDDKAVHLKGSCVYSMGSDLEGFHSGIRITQISNVGMEPFLSLINAMEKNRIETEHSLRPEAVPTDHIVQRISGEHKLITHYVIALQEMLKEQVPNTEPVEFEAILSLMKNDLTTHFYLEEKIFFKIGLTHLPTDFHGLIAELSEEHSHLSRELDSIMGFVVDCAQNNAPMNKNLKKRLKGFIEQVKEHTRKEITDLYPFMEENPRVKSILLETIAHIVSV